MTTYQADGRPLGNQHSYIVTTAQPVDCSWNGFFVQGSEKEVARGVSHGISHSASEFGVCVSSFVQFLTVLCLKQSAIHLCTATGIVRLSVDSPHFRRYRSVFITLLPYPHRHVVPARGSGQSTPPRSMPSSVSSCTRSTTPPSETTFPLSHNELGPLARWPKSRQSSSPALPSHLSSPSLCTECNGYTTNMF